MTASATPKAETKETATPENTTRQVSRQERIAWKQEKERKSFLSFFTERRRGQLLLFLRLIVCSSIAHIDSEMTINRRKTNGNSI